MRNQEELTQMSYEYPIPGTSDPGSMFGKESVKARGPLAALDGGYQSIDNLNGYSAYFPDDLRNIDHWVTFRAFRFEGAIRSRSLREDDAKKIPKAYITLPLAKGLSTKYDVSYQDIEAGGLTAGIANLLDGNLSDTTQNVSAIATGALADLVKGSAALRVSAAQAGIARNPHNIVLFDHVPFREHTFSYTFVPVSRSESEKLRTIISLFKHFMSPSLGTDRFNEFASSLSKYTEGNIAERTAENTAAIEKSRAKIIDLREQIDQASNQVGLRGDRLRKLRREINGEESKIEKLSKGETGIIGNIWRGAKDGTVGGISSALKSNVAIGAGRNLFTYPEYFEIDFHHPQFLFSIGPSMLTSFSVDYHPNNIPAYVRPRVESEDNSPAPQAVKLDFTFKEVEIVTKETIRENNR